MKKLVNKNALLSHGELGGYQFERVNSISEGHRFTKSIKDLVIMGKFNKELEEDNSSNNG